MTFKTWQAPVACERSFGLVRVFNERLFSNLCKPKMQKTIEQRYAIKFCVELEKSGTETLGTIKVLVLSGTSSSKFTEKMWRLPASRTDDSVQRVHEVLN